MGADPKRGSEAWYWPKRAPVKFNPATIPPFFVPVAEQLTQSVMRYLRPQLICSYFVLNIGHARNERKTFF
jgi:hypothetical protein